MALSLVERLGELNGPRGRNGRQYPMVGLLTLCLVAILAGHTTPEAIAQFGRLRQRRLGHALGFKNGNMPCANAVSGLLRKLDADHLDRIIGAWLADRRPAGWDHIALDGKRLCGSRDADVPGTHLLAAYAPRASAGIAQMTVDATANEHKAALRLSGVLPALGGAVATADAMFTHADVCAAVQQKGASTSSMPRRTSPSCDATSRPRLAPPRAVTFPPYVQRQWDEQVRVARASGKGHGRVERRTITATAWLNEYLSRWPGVAQVFRLERVRKVQGRTEVEVVYGITSLSAWAADAAALLGYARGHWGSRTACTTPGT